MGNKNATKKSGVKKETPKPSDGLPHGSDTDSLSLLSENNCAIQDPSQVTRTLQGSWARGPPNSGNRLPLGSDTDSPSLLSENNCAMQDPSQVTRTLQGSWARGPPNSSNTLSQPSGSMVVLKLKHTPKAQRAKESPQSSTKLPVAPDHMDLDQSPPLSVGDEPAAKDLPRNTESPDSALSGTDKAIRSLHLPVEHDPAMVLKLKHILEAQRAKESPESSNKLPVAPDHMDLDHFPPLSVGGKPAAKNPPRYTERSDSTPSEPDRVIRSLKDRNKYSQASECTDSYPSSSLSVRSESTVEDLPRDTQSPDSALSEPDAPSELDRAVRSLQDRNKLPQASECTDSHQSNSLSVRSEPTVDGPQQNLESPTIAPSEPTKATGLPQSSNKLPQTSHSTDSRQSPRLPVQIEPAVEDSPHKSRSPDIAPRRPSPAGRFTLIWRNVTGFFLPRKDTLRARVEDEKQDPAQPQIHRKDSPTATRTGPPLAPKTLVKKIPEEAPKHAKEIGDSSTYSVMGEMLRCTLALIKSGNEKINCDNIPSMPSSFLNFLRRVTDFVSPVPGAPGLIPEQASRDKENTSATVPTPIAPLEQPPEVTETTSAPVPDLIAPLEQPPKVAETTSAAVPDPIARLEQPPTITETTSAAVPPPIAPLEQPPKVTETISAAVTAPIVPPKQPPKVTETTNTAGQIPHGSTKEFRFPRHPRSNSPRGPRAMRPHSGKKHQRPR
ncbi:hypothetical protein BLS_002910 [Venturia inaequalis]|uniref:Uncharacterized protein n=1 Tax=Venturia inaequalis TaxID=5025 RepID=A0A8H3YR10_VENIN|nr:hypothetical protein EG328_008998 [Venturia inaequalis]KAE9974798.1 hypothetical protein BLS_002910 [Venturia inaequalis]KAE9994835.1 hypothetical protein EG327_000049 [Venturia inaequalis]